jgi:hypothetical protein
VLGLLALILFGLGAARFVAALDVRPRAITALMLTCALACAAMGLLGALSVRERSPIDLVFFTEAGTEVRTHEDRVTVARASLPALCLLAGVTAGLSLVFHRWRRRLRPRRPARLRRPLPRAAWLIALASAPYLLTFFGALLSPPRGYDALWYHLPLAVAFSRNHHLEPPGRDLVFYFPANTELLMRLVLSSLGPRASSLVQWPFALGASTAAYALAGAVGFRRSAVFAAAMVLAAPLVLFQSGLAYCDVFCLFAVTTAATLLCRALRAPLRHALVLALFGGLSLGLCLGAKYAALPLTACGLPIFGLCALAPMGRLSLSHFGRAMRLVFATTLGLLPPSLFWYARNLRLTGNPFFPITVPTLGLPGLFLSSAFNRGKELELVSSRKEWLYYPFIERVSHESGFGAAFACLVPVGVVVLLLVLVRRLRHGRVPPWALPLAWGLSYLLLWWVATPHEARHLLPLITLLGVPALALFQSVRARHPLTLAFASAVAFSTLTSTRAIFYSPVPELSLRSHTFAGLYDLPEALLSAVPAGAKIANLAGRPYNFPLLGPALDKRVHEYAPGWPSDHDLAFHQADFVFYRGPERSFAPRASWRKLYEERAENPSWWGATTEDIMALYALPPRAP